MAGEETDNGSGVAVAESAEPAATGQDTREAPRTLAQRMAAIRDECFGIGKDDIEMANADRSKKWKIKGHTVEAILSEIRPLLAKHGVDVSPSLVERTYSGNRCDVLVDFEFSCTDDADQIKVIRWAGAGTDNGDKAFAKAGTNALKEILKKRFLITDRDDAKEEAEAVEHKTDEGIARGDVDKIKEQRRSAIQQWAGAFKSAVENAKTADDVKRLRRDNRDQLDSEDLPDVTRVFFNDLIRERIAALED